MKRLPVEDDEVGITTDLLELMSGCDNGWSGEGAGRFIRLNAGPSRVILDA